MIENVKLTSGNHTIEIDREKTVNYVLDTVNLGERDTSYSIVHTLDLVGVERDIWYKRLSVVEIVGYVIADDWDAESMVRRKIRLNHFVRPKMQIEMVYQKSEDRGQGAEKIDFIATESVRYGKTHTENNEAFCKFQITGLYRRSDVTTLPPSAPLPAPTGIVAIRENVTAIRVSWNAVQHASGYRIEHAAAGGTPQTIENIPSGTTTFDIPGLTSGVTYSVRVRALGTGNFTDSPWSDTVSVPPIDTGVEPPSTPTNFRSTSKAVNAVSLAWNAVSSATSYGVQYRTGSGSWSTANVTITSTTAIVSGLVAGTTYEFQVRAINSGGSSAWSPSVFETTNNSGLPPTAPANFRQHLAVFDGEIFLRWDAQANLTGYTLEYRELDTTNWTTLTSALAANSSSVMIDSIASFGLPGSRRYLFRLTAINDNGSAHSDAAVLSAPHPPENFTVRGELVGTSGRNAVLEWSGQPYVTRYIAGSWSDDVPLQTLPPSATSAIFAIERGRSYFFFVEVQNNFGSNGEGMRLAANSNVNTGDPPPAPANFRVTGQTVNSVTLAWNALSNLFSYTLQYRPVGVLDWWTWIPAPGGNSTGVTITGLNANTTYEFRLTATNPGGSASSTTSATTGSLGNPQNLTISNQWNSMFGVNRTTFTWTAMSGVTAYRLEHINPVGNRDLLAELGANATSATINGLNLPTGLERRFVLVAITSSGVIESHASFTNT